MIGLHKVADTITDWSNFRKDFLFITLDSLRYDTAHDALTTGETPNLQKLVGCWECRHAAATYTLPSHISMFAGMMPKPTVRTEASKEGRLFALSTSWDRYRGRKIRYFFEDAENVPKGFESKGYETIGVGGVGWFSNKVKASSFWQGNYFKHFLYKSSYGEENPRAFEEQIHDLSAKLKELPKGRKFIFINISSTHRPYSNGDGTQSVNAQRMCLQYIDVHLPELLALFSPGTLGVVCGDHGDCMGEDGLWGHAIAHEKVLTVPYAEIEL